MGRPKTHAPAIIEAAVAEVRKNTPLRDVGQRYGVSATTVMRWVREAPPERRPVSPSAPPVAPELEGETPDLLPGLKRMMADFVKAGEIARAEGRHRDASAMAGHVGKLAPVIARLEQAANADPDALRVSRSEIEEAMSGVIERVVAICDRPLLCADCSRKLSVEWGLGRKVAPKVGA